MLGRHDGLLRLAEPPNSMALDFIQPRRAVAPAKFHKSSIPRALDETRVCQC